VGRPRESRGYEIDDATGRHTEGMTISTYNAASAQWSISFAGGRGELIAQETYRGKVVLMRGVWSQIAPNAHHFEESFSNDGGRNRHPDFIASPTRLQ
jgi:hypothetical protein